MYTSWNDVPAIWVVDYEWCYPRIPPFDKKGKRASLGDHPIPICYCAEELISGKIIKKWIFKRDVTTPKYMDDNSIFIAYNTVAEMSCHIVNNIDFPVNMVDLFTEFLNLSNGKFRVGTGLKDALVYYGLVELDASYKKDMQNRIIDGPPFSEKDIEDILEYNYSDIYYTKLLFNAMRDQINLKYALMRGRYTYSVAKIENNGIPINLDLYNLIKTNGDSIKGKLIEDCDKDYKYNIYTYDKTGYHWNNDKFLEFIIKNNLEWEMGNSGPIRNKEYMKQKARQYPIIHPLKDLMHSISQSGLMSLSIGLDGRNRASLTSNITITQRNTASSNAYIFGTSAWVRNLIKPNVGMALAHLDYSQEEFAIAAALSDDENMKKDYISKDPYIQFAIRSGAVPKGATKNTHPIERDKFKQCVLAVQYGAGVNLISKRADVSLKEANEMLEYHKKSYEKFWEWSNNIISWGKMTGELSTMFNWKYATENSKLTTLRNWMMQTTGAEILRWASCCGIENDIKICALIHDAILIESPIDKIEDDVKAMQTIMKQSALDIIDFEIFIDTDIIKYPNHYINEESGVMYKKICKLVNYEEK